VFAAIRAAGRDVDEINSDDLAGMDEFHALGRAGTLALGDGSPCSRSSETDATCTSPSPGATVRLTASCPPSRT
jgi:hypothetical protein